MCEVSTLSLKCKSISPGLRLSRVGEGGRERGGLTLDKRDPDHSAPTNRMATRWEQASRGAIRDVATVRNCN